MAGANYPLGKKAQVIGTPYKGTHAVAFNKRGGSDNWESENAYDLKVPAGTPVYAVAAGTIGKQIGPQGGGRFAGDRLHLVTDGNEFFYGHLSRLVVSAGDRVQAGQLLGYSGSADGVAHLHFAAKSGSPSAWLMSRPQGGEADPTAAAASTADAGSGSGSGSSAPADAVTPPVAGQSPDLGVTAEPVSTEPVQPPPGSGIYSTSSFLTSMWDRIASQPGASPDAQLLAANAQTLAGG